MSSLLKKLKKQNRNNEHFHKFKKTMNRILKPTIPQTGVAVVEGRRRLNIVAAMEEGLVFLNNKLGAVHPGEQEKK